MSESINERVRYIDDVWDELEFSRETVEWMDSMMPVPQILTYSRAKVQE